MRNLARHLVALAAACAATSCPGRAAGPPRDATELQQRLAARFDGDRTGACVLAAVIDHDRTTEGRFCAGTRADGPPAMDAAMEIGSVTKTMTAFLVADLVARGAWSLDDPIARHLPPGTVVPRQGERQILVRDLLTHTAGLPSLPPGVPPRDPADPYAAMTEADVLGALGRVQLARPIGSAVEYSNFGMMLVSLAVARSDGGHYEAALRERLFAPLGMHAWIARPGAEHPAQGHLPGGRPAAAWTAAPELAGFGMVHASLADMERYVRAGLGDGPPAVVVRLRRTQQPLAHGFAMNWMRTSVAGHDVVAHEGGTGGFSSLVALEPAAHRGVVLLADTNLTDLGGLGDLGLALLGLDVPVQPPRRAEPASAALKRALAGDYRFGAVTMHVRQDADGRLAVQVDGQPAFELHHDSHGDFYLDEVSALLVPQPQAAPGAAIAGFTWRQGGGEVEARRIAARAPTLADPAWSGWAGDYAITDRFALHVFVQDGRPMVQGTGQPAIEATPAGRDRLEIPAVGAVVEFERGADGRVAAAVLRQGGQVLRGARR